jgi:hypothetical protein
MPIDAHAPDLWPLGFVCPRELVRPFSEQLIAQWLGIVIIDDLHGLAALEAVKGPKNRWMLITWWNDADIELDGVGLHDGRQRRDVKEQGATARHV